VGKNLRSGSTKHISVLSVACDDPKGEAKPSNPARPTISFSISQFLQTKPNQQRYT